MKTTLAIYGGSFNPPANHHLLIINELIKLFEKIVVVPCGLREDKDTTNQIPLPHRFKMCELAFNNLRNTILDLRDLKIIKFTPSIELYNYYSINYDCTLVLGSDIIKGGAEGKSEIQRYWVKGNELWNQAKFCIISRDNNVDKNDLPPKASLLTLNIPGSSRDIREKIKLNQDIKDFLPITVYNYIQEYKLYK